LGRTFMLYPANQSIAGKCRIPLHASSVQVYAAGSPKTMIRKVKTKLLLEGKDVPDI
jgi:hypothetical protein